MTFWKWSRTAANNATADSTCPFPEGMAPSALNDGTRAMMAAAAKYRDDISGAIITTGTSTAYAVASNQGFDTLAHLGGAMIAFSPHVANTGSCTLNVDGLGAAALRSAPGVDITAGTILQGTPYLAVYNSTDNAFYLHGFFGNPYNVPIGGSLIYWGSVAPNSSFVLLNGSQQPSRTVFSTLFSILGTTYGPGNGTTTFDLPDCRGRVVAGPDAGQGRLTGATMNFLTPGGTGGSETRSLATANMPPYTPAGSVANGAITVSGNAAANIGGASTGGGQFGLNSPGAATITASQAASSFTGSPQGGSSQAFGIVQPTIIGNYIMRII
ncbi:phage tail protein [Bradyrhizobium sp. th.b2]|uniref:phage tail protein n=1 Tax=Bradyrhizobium sp. th-b2 TaxID=172088 RepID=UPI000491C1BF|nr:tail fiber protein [Bradyrhizobium sp. th.b2]